MTAIAKLTSILTLCILLVVAVAVPAMADRGERINEHLDRRGDRIEQRHDRRADIAESNGREGRAERLENRGDRIDNRLDRRGDRIDQRW